MNIVKPTKVKTIPDILSFAEVEMLLGSTRSDTGQKCRDTFTSLKKTCRKLGISFWHYLVDRIEYQNKYPPLAEIMESQMGCVGG